jgi:CsoR family transcriptional regulator, copper-sensing transcriptional repressor
MTAEPGGAPAAVATTQLTARLRRAEGQLRGVQRMLDEGTGCDDVLVQLAAVTAALDQVGLHLIGERLRQCQREDGSMCADELQRGVATLMRHTRLAR